MSGPVTRCWVASGRVQGVGFRWFARREAQRLGVGGWVRNLPDGSVEVVARAEPGVMAQFEAMLRQGPPHALVTSLDTGEVPQEPVDSKSFIVKH